jgi:hypothetical protein
VCTLFCGSTLWAYAFFFRKPVEIPTAKSPIVLAEKADHGHAITYAKRGDGGAGGAAGGHGAPAKDDGHGKGDAKKAEKKAEPKKDAKKAGAKKDAGHGGGGH